MKRSGRTAIQAHARRIAILAVEIMTTKVVAYIRVSTEEQATEGHSIETQRRFLKDYAAGHGMQIVRFFEESHSAYRPGRPEFQEMLDFLKARSDVRGVLVYKLDRLWRNEVDHASLAAMGDVCLVSATESIPEGSTGRFLTSIYAATARLSSDQTSERVKHAAKTKVENGGWPGPAPTGYVNNRAEKTIEPDPEMAHVVRAVFEIYAHENISLKSLVKRARDLGLRTKKGGSLDKGALHKLLTNPIYYGVIRYDGSQYPGNHDPIITKALFDRVQERMHGKSSAQTKRSFCYRGLMTCARCGCNITASRVKGKYVYYHCTNGKGECKREFVSERELSEKLGQSFDALKLTEDDVRFLLSRIEAKGQERRKDAARLKRNLQRQLKSTAFLRDQAYEDKLLGKISEERWLKMESRWDAQVLALEQQLSHIEAADGPAVDEAQEAFKLLQRAPDLYFRQSHEERARLLQAVLSNSLLDGHNLVPVYKKPFDLVAEGHVSGNWLPGEDSNLQPFG